ncbi:MAG TPA: RNA polymerase sigma factor [Bacteroidota bacterium]|nr:RNA polymerase sigma factor [Bacteroidota bacterium]
MVRPPQTGHEMPESDERQLISRARTGSHQAFRTLVERHMKHAYDVAFSFVRNHEDASDVAQEAFVRAYGALPSFREEAGFGTWLHRIVMNLAMNRAKRNRTRSAREVDAGEAAPAAEGPHGDDIRGHIERALHELPTLQRAVVILRTMDGLSTKQVSDILRCSEGTVKTHLFRGLKKMRAKLEFLHEDAR